MTAVDDREATLQTRLLHELKPEVRPTSSVTSKARRLESAT